MHPIYICKHRLYPGHSLAASLCHLSCHVSNTQDCSLRVPLFMKSFKNQDLTFVIWTEKVTVPFCDFSFVLPAVRFCLREMTVLTSGNPFRTSSLNCCSSVVSACAFIFSRLIAELPLEARHPAAFCALSRITTSRDNIACFTNKLACWRE